MLKNPYSEKRIAEDPNRLLRLVTSARVKRFRQEFNLSARKLAIAIGYSRSYVKSIEGGSLPVSAAFAESFLSYEKRVRRGTDSDFVFVAPYRLPRVLYILPRPRLCAGHKRPTIFATSNQKFCSAECRELYLRRQKKA